MKKRLKICAIFYLVIENSLENKPENKICESCGKEFSCGANVGNCWCFDVELKQETLAELRENFKSCLCEKCLEGIKK